MRKPQKSPSPSRLPALPALPVSLSLSLLLAGCADLPGTGTGDASTHAATTDAGDAGPAVVGTACGNAGPTQLCRATNLCPKVVVDSDRFPNCGFRIRGTVVDIQCVCNGESLCPLGTPSTCDQAAKLLASQSEIGTCMQVMDGRCTPLGATKTPTGTPDCDTICAASCNGEPTCRKSCGC